MKPAFTGLILALAAIATGPASLPARADFFQLDGRYQCLATPNAICGDATRATSANPKPVAPTAIIAPPMPPISQAPPAAARPHEPGSQDPVLAIAARVKSGHPTAADIAALRADTADGNPRAIELLAWCELTGLGTTGDPVDAYLLYGRAAAALVPHASENQAAIYEAVLTPEQRQHVLDIDNAAIARAQIAAGD